MYPLRSAIRTAFALLFFAVAGKQCSLAQYPTNWWPDPSTGLMWTGEMSAKKGSAPFGTRTVNGLTWQQAKDYCGSLQLAGFAEWRLPTLLEVKAVTVVRKQYDTSYNGFGTPGPDDFQVFGDTLFFKGGIHNGWDDRCRCNSYDASPEYSQEMDFWTSVGNGSDPNSAWVFELLKSTKGFRTKDVGDENEGVICVRSMEPDLLKVAQAAGDVDPVPDIQTLQTYIPLNNARHAYQVGNYQEAIAQAQIAISLKANPAVANWAAGISYGQLGQWDQAIASLQTALTIDKTSYPAMTALQWAKDGLKAAKKRKQPKEAAPQWN